MESFLITFLGTGNAIPTPLRNHTGILVGIANTKENILIDCGEGIQRQLRIARISPTKITRILITHWHGDHILGMPGLLQTLAMSNYQNTLKIYGPKGTSRLMQTIKELMIDFRINLEIHESSGGTITDEPLFKIESSSMSHGIPSLAYSIIIKDKIRLDKKKIKKLKLPNSPLLRDLQNGKDIIWNKKKIKSSSLTYFEKGKKLTFVLDTAMNENILKIAKNSDLLVCESTFSEKESSIAKEYKHLTSKDAGTIAKKSNSRSLILTHISQRYEHNPHQIEKEARKIFKNSKIAKDFDIVII